MNTSNVERIAEEHVGKFIGLFKLDINAELLTAELRQFVRLNRALTTSWSWLPYVRRTASVKRMPTRTF